MPNLNQKGPMGEGAIAGHKMGRCTNFCVGRRNQTTQDNENSENPINDNPQVGQGLGRGRGMGRGMGNGMGQNRRGRRMGRNGGGGRGMGLGREG